MRCYSGWRCVTPNHHWLLHFELESAELFWLCKITHPAGEFMKRFIIEQSDEEFYTSYSGIAWP